MKTINILLYFVSFLSLLYFYLNLSFALVAFLSFILFVTFYMLSIISHTILQSIKSTYKHFLHVVQLFMVSAIVGNDTCIHSNLIVVVQFEIWSGCPKIQLNNITPY